MAVRITPSGQRSFYRRDAIAGALAAGISASLPSRAKSQDATPKHTANRIAVSTYSYWRYRDDSKLTIPQCIDLAAEAGFDGVEILHVQMQDESNATLQNIKQRAFRHGLDLCGFSTHQSFVSPDPDQRREEY